MEQIILEGFMALAIPYGTVFILPAEHRRYMRTTNMLERLNKTEFTEERLRDLAIYWQVELTNVQRRFGLQS